MLTYAVTNKSPEVGSVEESSHVNYTIALIWKIYRDQEHISDFLGWGWFRKMESD